MLQDFSGVSDHYGTLCIKGLNREKLEILHDQNNKYGFLNYLFVSFYFRKTINLELIAKNFPFHLLAFILLQVEFHFRIISII